jgi:hypothetical protein
MVKKKDSSPLLSDDEVNNLLKDAEKREAPTKKKSIEKIATPKTIEKLPKKVTPKVKKEQEKIVEDIKNLEPKKEKVVIIDKSPEIEFVLKTVTKYDLNWYYLKEKLMAFKRWILSPYTRYANWFNKKFNSPKIVIPEYDKRILPKQLTMDDLYEDLPNMQKQIHNDVNKIIAERTKIKIIKEVK